MATQTPLINGQLYDWASITCIISTIPVFGITAIKYDEEQAIEDHYGAGIRPVGRGRGQIKVTASITLMAEEIEALQQASPDGRLQSLGMFDIIVSYAGGNGIITTHKLRNCEFTKNGRDVKTGDTSIEYELPLVCSHIEWK